jgi:hypothetical protein
MENWFKSTDPYNFAKTQSGYVKQIDDYMNRKTPRVKKKYNKQTRKDILKKIEKGYTVSEVELKEVSKASQGLLGATSIYNVYLMKILCQFNDPYIQNKYDEYYKKNRSKSGDVNVYTRMRKDAKRRETINQQNINFVNGSNNGSINIS